MISAIFILNSLGNVIISRVFREDVKYTVIDVFHSKIINVNANELKNPILTLGSTTFLYIKKGDLYYIAVTRNNSDASVILQYLNRLINLLKSLISVTPNQTLEDTQLMNNFLLIYEILDLTIDQGFVTQIDDSMLMSKIYSPISKAVDTDKKTAAPTEAKIIKKDIALIEPLDTNSLLSSYDENVISLLLNEYIYVKNRNVKVLGEVVSVLTVPSGLKIDFQFNTPTLDNSLITLRDISISPVQTLIKPSSRSTNKFNVSTKISTSVQPILDYSANVAFEDLPIIIIGSYKQLANDMFELELTLECRYPSDKFAKNIQVKIPIPQNTLKTIDIQSSTVEIIVRDEHITQTGGYLLWSLNSVSGKQKLKLSKVIYTDASKAKLSDWISTRGGIQVSFEIPKYNLTGYNLNSFNVEESFDNIANKLTQLRTLSHSIYEFHV